MRRQPAPEPPNRTGFQLMIGIALLFFTVVLIMNLVTTITEHGSWFSMVISSCGVLLFGSLGIGLLAGVIRHWLKPKK